MTEQQQTTATEWKRQYSATETDVVACPLCATKDFIPIAVEWGLRIVRCARCAVIYVSPRLRHPERSYWRDEAFLRAKYGAILKGERPHPRKHNYREHVAVLARVKPSGRLLDVGAHCGFFLSFARGRGWNVEGIEPSAAAASIARDVYGLEIHDGFIDELALPGSRYDVVTLVDVLEHVTEPRELLTEIARVLSPGGVLFIKVPNGEYNLLKYRLLKKTLRLRDVDSFDSREHVVHYTEHALTKLLDELGFAATRFYVPRPIQDGSVLKRAARGLLYLAARCQHAMTRAMPMASPDLAVLAWKK